MKIKKISCPHCQTKMTVEDALFHEFEAQIRKEFEEKYSGQVQKVAAKERETIEKEMKASYEMKIQMLQEENKERKSAIQALQQKEIKLLTKERNLEEQQEKMKYLLEKQELEVSRRVKAEAKSELEKSYEMKLKEYEMRIEDFKKQANEMKRKSEQGSMQLQGEVQELAIEQLLKTSYPQDEVEEVGKGIRGADVLHRVYNRKLEYCGSIVYESKRTKSFSKQWIAKLKEDQRKVKAEVAILVTEALPKGNVNGFVEMDGVIVCDYQSLENLVYLIRKFLVQINKEKSFQIDRLDKKELVYEFFISAQFKNLVDAILNNFNSLKEQLESEKRAMKKQWAIRENVIERVFDTTIELYGNVRAIAGPEVSDIELLELVAVD